MVYEWRCLGCGVVVEIERPMSECNVPPEGQCPCAAAAPGEWVRVFSAPALMQAAYPDGTRRKGFAEMREAAKLEKEMASRPRERRSEIAKEIRRLRRTDK